MRHHTESSTMRSIKPGLALLVLASMGLGGCVTPDRTPQVSARAPVQAPTPGRYASLASEPFQVAAIDTARIPARYLRQEVDFRTAESPGTIVIDTAARHLYFVLPEGRAMRYGVGVGKEGMSWSGVATVGTKRSWPDWYPPKEMIARRPDIEQTIRQLPSGRGLPGGDGNPLGARALYLYQDGKDTLYRIHGTLEPYTMGQAVSSGCVRMINQDAIDLFSRVEVGTRVVVLADAPRVAEARPAYDAHANVAVFPEGRHYSNGPVYPSVISYPEGAGPARYRGTAEDAYDEAY
jgi:lipoprotein-anchoring transpeptidase ErfK/SrfK